MILFVKVYQQTVTGYFSECQTHVQKTLKVKKKKEKVK